MVYQLKGKKSVQKVVLMEMLSAEYGWTINEINEQPFEYIYAYFEIINNKRLITKG